MTTTDLTSSPTPWVPAGLVVRGVTRDCADRLFVLLHDHLTPRKAHHCVIKPPCLTVIHRGHGLVSWEWTERETTELHELWVTASRCRRYSRSYTTTTLPYVGTVNWVLEDRRGVRHVVVPRADLVLVVRSALLFLATTVAEDQPHRQAFSNDPHCHVKHAEFKGVYEFNKHGYLVPLSSHDDRTRSPWFMLSLSLGETQTKTDVLFDGECYVPLRYSITKHKYPYSVAPTLMRKNGSLLPFVLTTADKELLTAAILSS